MSSFLQADAVVRTAIVARRTVAYVVGRYEILLYFVAGFGCSFEELVAECVGVASMSGTARQNQYFFAIIQSLCFFEYFSLIIS